VVKIGDTNKLRVGEWVIAIGSPFGFANTVTAGIVSAKSRENLSGDPNLDAIPFIQTDVAVNPGNSGGPLLNMKGEVIGINSQIFSRTGSFAGISFAIPIDYAFNVADQLMKTGRVVRGRIGVGIQNVTKDLSDSLGLGKAQGAVVGNVEDLRLRAPVTPSKIVCVGRNYAEHVAEGARARGEAPKIPKHVVFFTKAPTSVTGPFDDIPWDATLTQQVDWEAELGVIIGTPGINIRKSDALGHIFGYTVINDVTARDLQNAHFQFFKGKSLDGFCPIGPLVVTADEFGDPQNKMVSCRVNGTVRQHQRTSEMLFPVDVIIEVLSRGLTLEAGDVIATGTPEGAGFGMSPPQFLKDGDIMETEVEGIGVMRNRVRRFGD
jgi:2-keto-4-pentenoate hydratase/2-oxohepta-3-ene-1,7-dioic acid hydratase in catechol pathway